MKRTIRKSVIHKINFLFLAMIYQFVKFFYLGLRKALGDRDNENN